MGDTSVPAAGILAAIGGAYRSGGPYRSGRRAWLAQFLATAAYFQAGSLAGHAFQPNGLGARHESGHLRCAACPLPQEGHAR